MVLVFIWWKLGCGLKWTIEHLDWIDWQVHALFQFLGQLSSSYQISWMDLIFFILKEDTKKLVRVVTFEQEVE